jgi:hypothetical protein
MYEGGTYYIQSGVVQRAGEESASAFVEFRNYTTEHNSNAPYPWIATVENGQYAKSWFRLGPTEAISTARVTKNGDNYNVYWSGVPGEIPDPTGGPNDYDFYVPGIGQADYLSEISYATTRLCVEMQFNFTANNPSISGWSIVTSPTRYVVTAIPGGFQTYPLWLG